MPPGLRHRARTLALVATGLALAPAGGRADGPMVTVEDGHTGEVVQIPASELGPAPAATPPAEPTAALPSLDDPSLDTPRPTRWQPALMRCRRYRRHRYCEGPRRIPVAEGPAAELATRLGLGDRRAASLCLDRDPPAAWLEAVTLSSHPMLAFPVDGGRQGRGVFRARGRRPGHDGVDIMAQPGSTVRAVDDGLVAYADNELHGYGNVVLLVHADGTVTLYAHMRAAYVFAGQVVRMGQVIGEVGETGLARGPHLHFELRRGGRPIDPIPRFVHLDGATQDGRRAEFTPAP